MNRRHAILTAACLSVGVVTQLTQPSMAFRAPMGAVTGNNKLMQGVSDNPQDLSFSPVLLQLAKLLGRVGLAPGYYLTEGGVFSTEPSIDLRTLLLYQAGLIKLPLHPSDSRKAPEQKGQDYPSLSFSNIPEPRKAIADAPPSDLPSLDSQPLPREMERSQVLTPKTNVGQPDKISIIAFNPSNSARPASTPMVSLDVIRLQADLNEMDKDKPGTTELTADIPHLAMAMPRTNSMPFITRNMFRLWTWRTQETASDDEDELPSSAPFNYKGTFVIATTGAIKGITGRHFDLGSGRLLANNQGGELLLQTNVASVSIEPDATAAVEVQTKNNATVVRVYAIESGEHHAVSVKLPSGEKTITLAEGEALVVSNQPLADADVAGGYLGSPSRVSANMVRGKFPVTKYVEQELMLKSQATQPMEALTSLRHRVDGKPN